MTCAELLDDNSVESVVAVCVDMPDGVSVAVADFPDVSVEVIGAISVLVKSGGESVASACPVSLEDDREEPVGDGLLEGVREERVGVELLEDDLEDPVGVELLEDVGEESFGAKLEDGSFPQFSDDASVELVDADCSGDLGTIVIDGTFTKIFFQVTLLLVSLLC